MNKIVVVIELADLTQKEYDAACTALMEQGKLYNEKRPVHIAFNKDGKWCVIDVWDSEEALNDFITNTLGPVFMELGIKAAPPSVYKVHSYVGAKPEELISA